MQKPDYSIEPFEAIVVRFKQAKQPDLPIFKPRMGEGEEQWQTLVFAIEQTTDLRKALSVPTNPTLHVPENGAMYDVWLLGRKYGPGMYSLTELEEALAKFIASAKPLADELATAGAQTLLDVRPSPFLRVTGNVPLELLQGLRKRQRNRNEIGLLVENARVVEHAAM